MLDTDRYYNIGREEPYPTPEKEQPHPNPGKEQQRADILVQRYEIETDNGVKKITEKEKVFIEAKRAEYFSVDIQSGSTKSRKCNIDELIADVKKVNELDHSYAFKYILTWGYKDADNDSEKDCQDPEKLFSKIESGIQTQEPDPSPKIVLNKKETRYFPMANTSDSNPKIIRWGWIMLIEIKNSKHKDGK
jgi:hypothetical protein